MNFDESRTVELDIEDNIGKEMNRDARAIFDKIDNTLGSTPEIMAKQYQDQIIEEGRWISLINEKYVISAYFHPTKRHSATVMNGFFKTNISKVSKEKGEWAIAYLPKTLFFNKAYYNIYICSYRRIRPCRIYFA